MSTLYDPAAQARDAGAAVVDDPIINPPYDEPKYYWDTVDWETKVQKIPQKVEGRRPAGYFYNRTGPKAEGSLLEEEFVALDCVNEIRDRVRAWRQRDYPGVTPATRDLLHYWSDPSREPRLFFCQREAAETVIWLTEASPTERAALFTQSVDGERIELDKAHEPFRRYCCKMATGTGKTVVMAMLIAWQTINKALYPRDTRFTNAFLVVGPGLTVAERLQVLRPSHEDNYYDKFDLIPTSLRGHLGRARVCILHRQAMVGRTDEGKRSVVKLGSESDSAFANRLLKRVLGSATRIFVINDEGHHCYRPRAKVRLDADGKPTKEEKDENERAAQWIEGLEKIGRVRTIQCCLDFSATPYYIHGSGYPVGRPFPWIVSDFGLLDAIESGLVKIPQLPVDDNHGDGKRPPAYFHLWRWVNEQLPPEDRYKPTRRGNAHQIAIKAQPAINTMIGNWKRTFDSWQKSGSSVPPCMIIVCQDTHISEEVFNIATREEFEWDHFANKPGRPQVSFLFDSKALKDVSRAEEGEKVKDMELRLREILNTVGKDGKPGEQVRFVCSVSMLTEGWDANNVTQIVGLRAFTSQLLCEQVVGRALRRRSYDVDPETGLLEPEYADIYGVPFQVIPVKASKAGKGAKPPVTTLVRALPEREHLKITFPRVEGYVHEVRERVRCAWDELFPIEVGASGEPTITTVSAVGGIHVGLPSAIGPSKTHTRAPYYQTVRMQATLYRVAAELVEQYIGGKDDEGTFRRAQLFPQFLAIVQRFVQEFVVFKEAPREEMALLKWQRRLVDVLSGHIYPVDDMGKEIIFPRIERSRGTGSTREVFFHTSRPCYATTKSHISHVVLDSPLWEKVATQHLETCDIVRTYARNDHLDFTIPYVDFTTGQSRNHRPDFIVVSTSDLHIALEIKGLHREVDDAKVAAGKKWAKAVNNHGGFGKWVYHICHNPDNLTGEIVALTGSE